MQDANLAASRKSKRSTWRSIGLLKIFWHWKNLVKTIVFHFFFYVCHTIAKVNFGLCLEGLGRLLGSTWRVLGASWAQLGLNLGALGANLGTTWALLGPTWEQPGRPRDHLGRSWGQLGRTLSYLDFPKLLLGCSWRLLGASWRPQGAVLAVQSVLRNSTWRPKALRGANSGGLELSQMPSWRN